MMWRVLRVRCLCMIAAVGVLWAQVASPTLLAENIAATSPCASGAILPESATAGWQMESPAALRFSPPNPYIPANPITAPITTAPIASGIRRVAVGRGGVCSGISFVILYQIRLCRAWVAPSAGVTIGGQSRTRHGL